MRTLGTHVKAAAMLAALAVSAGGAMVSAQDDAVTLGFVPPALTSPFHVAMVDGATARGGELGWTVDVQAPTSEGDFAAFVTTVQQLLEKSARTPRSPP
jgi:ABC-type sugar transport system substrate-binding protein